MTKILGISGSLRYKSYNTALLQAVVPLLDEGLELDIATLPVNIPDFTQFGGAGSWTDGSLWQWNWAGRGQIFQSALDFALKEISAGWKTCRTTRLTFDEQRLTGSR